MLEAFAQLNKTNNIVIPAQRLFRNSCLSLRNASQALWQSNVLNSLEDCFAHCIRSQRHCDTVSQA